MDKLSYDYEKLLKANYALTGKGLLKHRLRQAYSHLRTVDPKSYWKLSKLPAPLLDELDSILTLVTGDSGEAFVRTVRESC